MVGAALAAALQPEDRIALITFSHQVRLLAPMGPAAAVRARLPELSASGATALRDAVQVGLASQLAERTRSLMLLLTDGLDSGSWLSEEEIEMSARRSNMVIHALHFEADRFLDRLTEITGGRTWNVESERQLQQMFLQALDEMRARYVLTYSQERAHTPGWHEIKVSLRNARGEVTARRGYSVD